MNGIIWHESNKNTKSITLKHKVESACLNHLLIQGEVFEFPLLNRLPIQQAKQLVCNEDSVLCVTHGGQVYGWGLNSSKLLNPEGESVKIPTLIPKLVDISQVSISTSHAAAIDKSGLLYTWGSALNGRLGYNTMSPTSCPELVLSSRVYKSLQVVCGSKFTSIRTDGCYLHIYGDLGASHPMLKLQESRSPTAFTSYSHPELDKHSIIEISAGRFFLAALSDTGEVFIFDSCMDVVKLPVHSEAKVLGIIAGANSVWGYTQDYMLHWKANDCRSRNYCELASWSADVFDVPEQTPIFSWGNAYLMLTESLDEPVHQLRPYKRSEYAKRLFHNALESPSLSMVKEDRVPIVSFEDLERLFPNGDSQHTMEKIMKIRIEHYKYEIICKAFTPVVHPVATFAINKIKEFAWMRYLYNRALKVTNLVAIFNSYIKQMQSMSKLKFLWRLKALNRIHAVVSRIENVKIIEKSSLAIAGQTYENLRDVFTAIRIGKNVKDVERFRIQVQGFVRKDLIFAFKFWANLVKKIKNLSKIAKVLKKFQIRETFAKLKFGAKKILEKIEKLSKVWKISEKVSIELKSQAFHKLRQNITNSVLVKFHKRYVLELFLKLVFRTISTKISSINSDSFLNIKLYKQQKYFRHPLALFLYKSALRVKNSAFKSITKQGHVDPLFSLKFLLKSRFHSLLSQFNLYLQHLRLRQIANFSITLHKVLSNSLFKKKLHIFYKLKQKNLSRSHSVNNKDNEVEDPIFDSSSELSKRSNSRNLLNPYLTCSADHRYFHRGHSASSPSAVRRSHCCFNGSPCFNSPQVKDLYKYYKGEKVSYEKYLVLKKIDELKDQPLSQVLSPLHTPKKKKSQNEKPPWKPASVYTHSHGQKNFSAIKKGFEYNEALRRKLMKQRASNDLNDSKMTIITHEKTLINKVHKKPVPEGLNNIVSLPVCKDTLSIGLASMVSERVMLKIAKRLQKQVFSSIQAAKSSPLKQPAPNPFDSPKVVALNDTLNLIKNDWQLGIVVVAADKTRLCLRKIIGKDLFGAMKSLKLSRFR